ncbi:MAG: hypothetical protein PHG85_02310 [Candidatus Altiarchaeota archaeon]|nr:hypothetical protein [Candidatus Altiarchaeota archaeon]
MADSTGNILVLVVPEDNYSKNLVDLAKSLSEKYKTLCYVSLNRPCKSVMQMLTAAGVDLTRFYFMDAITKTARVPEPMSNVTYISSPGALTEISLAVANFFNVNHADCFIFDSLSTLSVHESETVIAKFVHFLMAKLKIVGCDSFFTVLKTDENSILMKDVKMFADQIVEIGKWR